MGRIGNSYWLQMWGGNTISMVEKYYKSPVIPVSCLIKKNLNWRYYNFYPVIVKLIF